VKIVEAIMAAFAVAVVAAVVIAILAICGIVLVVSAGIRAEDRHGTLSGIAPSRTARTARRWTGMGARWV
jgi:hypothetical protein